MATLQVLKTYYSNIMRADFAHIPATDQALLSALSSQIDGGSTTLAAAQAQIAKLAIGTTSVASVAYSFFTGGTPSGGGFDYLVSPNGPNPTNLNSAYYQSFGVENRYINFAVNLGKSGEGAASFTAAYGALSMADALAKAYTEIFGTVPDAAKIDALLNDQVPNGQGGTFTRQAYFASYGGDGLTGQGTKAAMVGWLMAEAVKADVGSYAKANDAFLADLGPDGVAAFRTSLIDAYGTPAAGTTGATLTAAADKSISPTASDATLKSTANNDTITGTAGLNADQTIDAGAGRDKISLTGTIYGKVTTADGGDTITLGSLGATAGTLGVPAQFGNVALAGGGTTVTLKGDMAQGTSLTATGLGNTLHVDGTDSSTYAGTVSGFQTVYYHTARGPLVSGASTLYLLAGGNITQGGSQTVILKDNGVATRVDIAGDVAQGAKAEIHLQNFQGAATTDIGMGAGFFNPNGGAIGLYVNGTANGQADDHGTLTVHVDTNSTVGVIYGFSTNGALSANYRGPVPNLTIVGAGKLTAQIWNNFTNVDATQAGDLNLTYAMNAQSTAQTLRLGDGTNVLNLVLSGSTSDSLIPASEKIYLGGGVDTVNLTTKFMAGQTAAASLSNLHIQGGATLSNAPEIINFQKGVDHLVLDAQVHAVTASVQQYADGKASLQAALIEVSAHVAANTAAVFTYGGDTYVYAQDATIGVNMANASGGLGDGLIKLTGVTGLTVGTGAGSFDIHYG